MRRKVMLKEVISAVKLSLLIISCWPLSQNATRLKVLCVRLHHYFNIVLIIGLLAPFVYTFTNHIDDPIISVQLITYMIGFLHTALNFVFCRINGHHIQNVTAEMEHFSNFMQPHEEIIIQRHIDSCIPFYGMSMFIFYFTPISSIIIKPANQTFPTIAEYPFDVYYQPLKAIIYIHQSIVGLIVGAQLCTNIFMALLLWFASARFEILIERIRKITNVYQLFKCIKKHQELLNYARKVATVAGPFAFLSTCCSTIGLITVFLLWVTNQPIITIILSFGLVLISLTEVFMYIWPAEYLIYTSEDVGQAVFDMLEHNYFIGIWKYLQIIIMRSQKPVNVSIPCLLPALSYHYFTSYLSTVLSYFTTLRIMMTDDKN